MLGKIEDRARDTISGNIDSQAHGDFLIRNFNGMQTVSYFDVRIFSSTCDSNKSSSVADNFSKMEKLKIKTMRIELSIF